MKPKAAPVSPELRALERQLSAIDRKQEAPKRAGVGPDRWLEQQGHALHVQREAMQRAEVAARLHDQGWSQ